MRYLAITFLLASTVLACKDSSKSEEAVAPTTDKQEVSTPANGTNSNNYKIDIASSTVNWSGYAMMHQHNGTFKVSEGSIALDEKNNISGGTFTVDINSLQALDLAKDAEKKGKLEGHLKSPDFFDAAKYPSAKFEITKATPNTDANGNTHLIYGNLTLKDSTKNVSFPAKVTINGNSLAATAKFKINKLDFGMVYGNDESLKVKDMFIKPEVEISLDVKATK